MDNYFSSSPSVLGKMQIFTSLALIIGLFFFDFTIFHILLSVLFFYLYSIVGLTMTLHRYYTHKSFKMGKISKILCTFIALLAGRGSPLGWVYIHRLHHTYSDTDSDPHSPHKMGFRLFGFKPVVEHGSTKLFLIKDLMNPFQLFINKWYVLIILVWLCILSLISIQLVYFTWIIPVFAIHVSQNCFNYFAHKYGYRNFETKDTSTNNFWLWPFILGDAWHNNHHANPRDISTKTKWFEFDPVATLIRIIDKNV